MTKGWEDLYDTNWYNISSYYWVYTTKYDSFRNGTVSTIGTYVMGAIFVVGIILLIYYMASGNGLPIRST